MYRCASTFSQLTTVFDALNRFGGESSRWDVDFYFAWQFEFLARQLRDAGPEWPAVDIYMNLKEDPGIDLRTLLDKYISDGALSEALNSLLNRFLRLNIEIGPRNFHAEEVVDLSKRLLDRGANLYFRNGNKRFSSIGALIEFTKNYERAETLSEICRHMCCPLLYQREIGEVIFDPYRVIPLSCLAAIKISRLEGISELPRDLRQFVEAHQELQSLVGGNSSSTSINEASMEAGVVAEKSAGMYRAPLDDTEFPSDLN